MSPLPSASPPAFDAALLARYDVRGPRYTSYPTALQFDARFTESDYRECIAESNADPVPAPLSLYVHVPFCERLCYYCACTKLITRDRRRAAAYLDALGIELRRQAALFSPDRRVEQIHWGGGTPTFLSFEEMAALMDTTRRCFRLAPDAEGEFSIEVDPRTIGADAVAPLRTLGFNRLSLGVQDFDERVQAAVNRIQPARLTLDIMAAARRAGFRSISVDLIYGLPRQSVSSFERTLEHIVAAAPDRISVFNYAHLPDQFRAQRLIAARELPDPAEKLRILQATIERLTAGGYRHVGMDHFAKETDELCRAQDEGTLARTFQGYSTHGDCDIVGLGMSAISAVGDCYSQNGRRLRAYMELVDDGRFPVERGVRLTEDDRVRRSIIGDLICGLRADGRWFHDRYGREFWDYFGEERGLLRPLEDDGLVEIQADGLRVTPRGRLLVRNVCMVFDRHLRERPGAGRYSRAI
ncbi:MAG TPA: oxygen-independent coproporphyrinogen III oxidase [Gammaproteobacteria bacterium]|jgi:oxygen-independent coproporphyrinogen-3 oxidase